MTVAIDISERDAKICRLYRTAQMNGPTIAIRMGLSKALVATVLKIYISPEERAQIFKDNCWPNARDMVKGNKGQSFSQKSREIGRMGVAPGKAIQGFKGEDCDSVIREGRNLFNYVAPPMIKLRKRA